MEAKLSKEVLAFALRREAVRTLADFEATGAAPVPWAMREYLAGLWRTIIELEGPGDDPPEPDFDF